MTFSLSASGSLEEVASTLASQAEQYFDASVQHVVDFVNALAARIEAPHGVSVSAVGHAHSDTATATVSVAPLAPPPAEPAADPGAAPVS